MAGAHLIFKQHSYSSIIPYCHKKVNSFLWLGLVYTMAYEAIRISFFAKAMNDKSGIMKVLGNKKFFLELLFI